MRVMQVQASIADPGLMRAVRSLLSGNPKLALVPSSAARIGLNPFADNTGSWDERAFPNAGSKLLLICLDEFIRFEADNPGFIDELRGDTKLVLLLESKELSVSMKFLRICDGMIIRDVNLDRISEIIELAFHGYFVIPRHLMFHFNLASAPVRGRVVEQRTAGASQSPDESGPGCPNGIFSSDLFYARGTMSKTVRKVINRINGGSHGSFGGTPIDYADDAPRAKTLDEIAITPSKWRRIWRNRDGRVTTLEFALVLAALGVWAAIMLEGTSPANLALHCPAVGPFGDCRVFGQAAKFNLAHAKPKTVAIEDQRVQEALRRTTDQVRSEPGLH